MSNGQERPPYLLERRVLQVERRVQDLERRLDAVSARLEEAVDVAIRVTRLVAVLNGRVRTAHRQQHQRMDRLAETIIKGRTADAERLAALQLRLTALEAGGR